MPYSVLVVDDEALTLRTVSRGLREEGFEVFVASSGEEALKIFHEEKPDLTLLDIVFPGMDGVEVLRELQHIRPQVRVVLTSGFDEVEAIRRFEGKRLAGFIQKPYTAVALAEQVKQALTKN